jgi:hypothetical protein
MNDQYKGTRKQSFAWWDAGGLDIPQGTHAMIHTKFKEWEKRRGFAIETNFLGNSPKNNENKPKQAKKSLKRSEHSEYAMNSQKSKSSVVITKQTQSNVTQTCSISQASNNSTSIKSFEDKNKLNVTTQLSQDSNSDRISRTNNDEILKQELDLNELLTLADNDEFPKKEYIINKKIKYY